MPIVTLGYWVECNLIRSIDRSLLNTFHFSAKLLIKLEFLSRHFNTCGYEACNTSEIIKPQFSLGLLPQYDRLGKYCQSNE